MTIVYGCSRPIIAYCTISRSFIFVYITVLGIDLTSNSKSFLFPSYFLLTVLPSAQLLTIFQYFVFGPAVTSQCQLLWYLFSFSFCLCSSTLLSHCANLHSTPTGGYEVLKNVLRQLSRIIRWCVAVAAHRLSNVIILTHITQITIDCFFATRVRELFCGSSSSAFVHFSFSLSTCSPGVYTNCFYKKFSDGSSVAQLI